MSNRKGGHLCDDGVTGAITNLEQRTVSTSVSAINIPALRFFYSFPLDVRQRIGSLAEHTHVYKKVIPLGPRDNNEYKYICQTCGNQYTRAP